MAKVTKKDKRYWDNKWEKSPVLFKAQDGVQMDVRNFILEKSYLLRAEAMKYSKLEFDSRALKILKDTITRLSYRSDQMTHKQNEFWQNPEETFQLKSGDCEDGGLLISTLLLLSGVPEYRVKMCCGLVNTPNGKIGHAYCIYLADDDQWYTLDWCFFPGESIKAFKKKPHSERVDIYLDIWFTFNSEFSWAQESTVIEKE